MEGVTSELVGNQRKGKRAFLAEIPGAYSKKQSKEEGVGSAV